MVVGKVHLPILCWQFEGQSLEYFRCGFFVVIAQLIDRLYSHRTGAQVRVTSSGRVPLARSWLTESGRVGPSPVTGRGCRRMESIGPSGSTVRYWL